MKAWMFIDSLLFSKFNYKELCLNDIAVDFSMKYNLNISKQGIDERFNASSVKMVKSLLFKMIEHYSAMHKLDSVFSNFKSIRIKDSTSFQLPENMSKYFPGNGGNSSEAVARIQYEFDLKNGKILEMDLQPVTNNDYSNAWNTRDSIGTGDLIIRDLGYSSLKMLKEIDIRKAYYLNRVKPDVAIFEKIGNKYITLNLKPIEAMLRKEGVPAIEKHVFIGDRKFIPVRLIIMTVPEDKIQERINRQKRKSKRRSSKNNPRCLETLGLNLFVTNTQTSILPLGQVYELYKLRWQIELIFKAWKSIGQVHLLKKAKPERILTLLYLKLLWVLMNMNVINALTAVIFNSTKMKLSVLKAFKIFQCYIEQIRQCIHNKIKLEELLGQMLITIKAKALTEKRKCKIFSLDIILSFAV